MITLAQARANNFRIRQSGSAAHNNEIRLRHVIECVRQANCDYRLSKIKDRIAWLERLPADALTTPAVLGYTE